MRAKLAQYDGQTIHLEATVDRVGRRTIQKDKFRKTLLLTHLQTQAGELICDHLWIDSNEYFDQLRLLPGEKVLFSARVSSYYRGYFQASYTGRKTLDYELKNPRRIRRKPDGV